jgi:hypothetical protein
MSHPEPTPTPDEPLAAWSNRRIETELLGLAGHIAAAQCRFLQLLAEFDRRGGWAGPGLRSCAHWLSWRIGMSLRTAAEHIRVAHALAGLPLVTEAFAEGRISYSKVRAITRITATGLGADDPDDEPESGHPTDPADPDLDPDPAGTPAPPASPPPRHTEKTLLHLAMSGTASHVETVVRAVRRRQADPAKAEALRSLSWSWAADGSLLIKGRLSSADGAALVAAVEALVPRRAPVCHPVPAPPADWKRRAAEEEPGAAVDRVAARRADALLALVTGTVDPGGDPDEAGATEAGRAHREDGITEAAPAVRRGQARIVVHVEASTGTARIAGGPELPAATAERLACDAQAQLLLSDTRRNRLYLGRNRRLASPAQIAALTLRDEGRCQFPGCAHAQHLHAHHVVTWLRGGRTDIDNLVLLCTFHHKVLHDRGFLIRRLGGGWEVRRPDGTPIPEAGAPLTGNVERLVESDARAGRQITNGSLTPTWYGERLDPAPILDALLPRRTSGAEAA